MGKSEEFVQFAEDTKKLNQVSIVGLIRFTNLLRKEE